jgi:hypothetical protein
MKRNHKKSVPYHEYMASLAIAIPLKENTQNKDLSSTVIVNTSGEMEKIPYNPGPYPHGLKEKIPPVQMDWTQIVKNDYAFPIKDKDGTIIKIRYWTPEEGYADVELW